MHPAKSEVQLKLRLHQVATQWEDVQNMIFQDDRTTGSSTRRPTKGHFLKKKMKDKSWQFTRRNPWEEHRRSPGKLLQLL